MNRHAIAGLLAVAAGALPGLARAALGEPETSVEADRTALAAVDRGARTRAGYTVREVQTASAAVREYVGPSGLVFAVAWSGIAPPDLETLLGAYAGEVRAADARTPRGAARAQRRVRSANVVVERWGHMRNLQGRAFLPALLPPGVTVDEIQ